jgi:pimeloyl-ACP methyl ester carboxylesterase
MSGLENAGLRVVAVDPPSLGPERAAPADLHGDAAHVREVLDQVDAPVVLLGHSYGGAIITEAGVHPNVRHLVYLAALIPNEDETSAELLGAPAESGLDDHPVLPGPAEDSIARFYNDCDVQTAAWAASNLRAQPLTWMSQRPLAAAWRERPSTYVVCADDRAIPADLQRVWATRCTTSTEWDSGHSPFLSHPTRVVDLLKETVASLIAG